MDLVDADRLFAGSRLDLHAAVAADRQIQLGNLIVLRVIRVKIVLAVKFTILGNRTVRRKSDCHRIFHHLLVQYRKDPGIPVHTGQVWLLGAPPKAVEQPQKIFVFVANSTWTSSPITVSYVLLIYLILTVIVPTDCVRSFWSARKRMPRG